MILVDRDIRESFMRSAIVIVPFDEKCLGTNSYDVHLGPKLLTYTNRSGILDIREHSPTIEHTIGEGGFVLEPGELYLASTVEYTESHEHLPILNGRSSVGRKGLSIHVTAGTGDVGFCGHWTMELFVIRRLRVYAGMAIGQLLWLDVSNPPDVPYGMKRSAKYNNRDPLPQPSKLHQE